MHDGVWPMRGEGGIERACIGDARFHQRSPAHGIDVTTRKIVEHDGGVPGSCKRLRGMGSDVAGAPCDKNASDGSLPIGVAPQARV